MQNFYTLFMHFYIYSIIGWILEVIYCKILDGKFYNRGFLNGPYCPIYGFGAIFIVILLKRFSNNPFLIFSLGLILTSILEYVTSFIMEKVFNTKWWDYSNYKFNINGRVCLKNSFMFGLLSIVLIYGLDPLIDKLTTLINMNYLSIISNLLFASILIDLSITIMEFIHIKERLVDLKNYTDTLIKEKNIFSENSEAYKKLASLKEMLISKKKIFNSRILKAFPDIALKQSKKEFLKIKELLNKMNK